MASVTTREALRAVLSGTLDSVRRGGGSDSCLRLLLQGIVSLEFEPGQVVSERQLMERTGSSRASLRQAVARLSELGLITAHARKGLVVAPLDVLEVSAVYDARLAIETAVARLAAQRATPEQLAHLQELLAASQLATEEEDAVSFVSRDMALHLAIAAAARNPYLEDALIRILPLGARLWHLLYRELGTHRKFMFEHTDIVAAIASRDPDAAQAAIAAHLQSAREILANTFMPRGEELR
jgi:DNA-binding GntR family transcriptional regulator